MSSDRQLESSVGPFEAESVKSDPSEGHPLQCGTVVCLRADSCVVGFVCLLVMGPF